MRYNMYRPEYTFTSNFKRKSMTQKQICIMIITINVMDD